MSKNLNRRDLLARSAGWTALGLAGAVAAAPAEAQEPPARMRQTRPRFKLGMITYNLAHDWTLGELIERCKMVGIEAVELRSTHKHGVEPTLSEAERAGVKKRCADGGLIIYGLGSACEYHSPDPVVVRKNIEDTYGFIQLAADLGAKGVKVRPNGLPKEVDEEKTLEQIGKSLRTVGQRAADAGVEIWCEMHGHHTSEPSRMKKIMDIADHPSVGVAWNSNKGVDDVDGSIADNFRMMRPKIYHVHINELVNGYPYRQLFNLLNVTGYDRYTMIEAQALKGGNVEDTIRFIRFYKALWEELSRPRLRGQGGRARQRERQPRGS